MSILKPWVCPKCQRVWGPLVDRCRPCNQKIEPQLYGPRPGPQR